MRLPTDEWENLNFEQQDYLWKKMLRGKVANYKDYEPNKNA